MNPRKKNSAALAMADIHVISRMSLFLLAILAAGACSKQASLVEEGEPFGTVSVQSDDRVELVLVAIDGHSVAAPSSQPVDQPIKVGPGRHSVQVQFRFHTAATSEVRHLPVFIQKNMHHMIGVDYRGEHATLVPIAAHPIVQK